MARGKAALARKMHLREAADSRVKIRPGMIIVMIGDSLTTAAYEYWRPFADAADASFVAAKKAPVTWVNSGQSGFGVTALAPGGNLNNSVAALVTAFNPHAVVIFAGVNDATGGAAQAVYSAGLTSLASACVSSRCPAAQVGIVSPWLNGAADALMDQYLVASRAVGVSLGCPFVDVRTGSPAQGTVTVDGIHPNAAGKTYLSGKLVEAVAAVAA